MPSSSFIVPQYGGRCFADLPQTILSWFTGAVSPALSPDIVRGLPDRYDNIVFLYLDAFGWRYMDRHLKRSPLLQRIQSEGVITPITAQFPSTTAAHVTSIHTGLPVSQSGVYEWQYYEPQLDAMIASLLFSFAGDKQRDTLKPTGIDPAKLYPPHTIYQELHRRGIRSTVLQHREYTPSTYSSVVFKGARYVPYATLPEALTILSRLLAARPGPAYYFMYFDRLDHIGHLYGPETPYMDAELDILLMALDHVLFRTLAQQTRRSLVILTSDHGHVDVHPKKTVYLNRDGRFEGYERFFRKNRQDKMLVPAGSPRDFFLYIVEDRVDEALSFFADRLVGMAEVRLVSELIDQGYFGPAPMSEAFLSRVGNLVILPYPGESVWWYEKDRFEQKFLGHHGGLTRQEMEVPLMLYPFGK